jgi:hypothetical protein
LIDSTKDQKKAVTMCPRSQDLKSGEIWGNMTVRYNHKSRRHSNADDGWTNSKGNRWFLLMLWLSWCAMSLHFFLSLGSPSEPRPPPCRGFVIALCRHTAFGRTPLCEWSARRKYLYLTKKLHSQERDIYALGGNPSRNPNKRTAADPRLRLRVRRDRLSLQKTC